MPLQPKVGPAKKKLETEVLFNSILKLVDKKLKKIADSLKSQLTGELFECRDHHIAAYSPKNCEPQTGNFKTTTKSSSDVQTKPTALSI